MSQTPPPDPLAELRPYQLPDPVGWWPPAPGWWLLALLAVAAAAGALWWWRRRRQARAALGQAERELAVLCAAFAEDGDVPALARGCSRLLRRLAVARFGRTPVAGLTGEAWLAFLDARGGGETFRFGVGRALREAPYRRPPERRSDHEDVGFDGTALCAAVRAWIQCQRDAGAREGRYATGGDRRC